MNDVLLFLVVTGGLILGHELGHFLIARWRGVQIEEFGLGFPPRVATLFYWRGTRISLNLIPFGGFVRPAGEDDPAVPNGLSASSKRTRTLVLLAGPATNILLGLLAFTAAFRFAAPDLNRVLITEVAPGSPAAEAGILPGDIVLRVDDQPITAFEDMQAAILSRLEMPVTITVERDGQAVTTQLIPRSNPPEGQGAIGVFLGYPTKPVGLPQAVGLGCQTLAFQIIETFRLPARLLHGQVAPEQARVSGLKGIYDMLAWASGIDQSTGRPFLTLQLVGVISVGLAIANLLPIPALDGGRLVFVVYEAIFRRRVAPRHEGLAHAIGFALLLVIMVYVTIQDFVNPIILPR